MKTNLKAPCKECPFRKVHPPGWLGPWESARHVIVAAEFDSFPCHRTITPGKPLDEMEACAGAARFLANTLNLPRDSSMAEARRKIGQGADVFASHAEMVAHHEQRAADWIAKTKETTE